MPRTARRQKSKDMPNFAALWWSRFLIGFPRDQLPLVVKRNQQERQPQQRERNDAVELLDEV
jgi:hypothetical protein